MDLYHFISASELFFFSPLSPLGQFLSAAGCLWFRGLPEAASPWRAGGLSLYAQSRGGTAPQGG